ncbi:MAG TPA: class I SAM-dependent methyltransferase [Bacteroidia bacterium]
MDLSKVKDLYDHNISEFGIDPRSVGWGTQEKINNRFRQLFYMISEPAIPFSLNELGSGYGEAVKYCLSNGFNIAEYVGLDISEKMLAAAGEYLASFPNKKLILASALTEKKDYSIASGIFNVMFDSSQEDWDKYILNTLHNMNDFSEKGFSFNMLTSYVDYRAENLNYGDSLFYFDYCKKHFSKNVSLLHDYNLYEFTIVVRK